MCTKIPYLLYTSSVPLLELPIYSIPHLSTTRITYLLYTSSGPLLELPIYCIPHLSTTRITYLLYTSSLSKWRTYLWIVDLYRHTGGFMGSLSFYQLNSKENISISDWNKYFYYINHSYDFLILSFFNKERLG